MKARCFCKNHGKLSFDDIIIRGGNPICRKCSSVLDFGEVRPRKIK